MSYLSTIAHSRYNKASNMVDGAPVGHVVAPAHLASGSSACGSVLGAGCLHIVLLPTVTT